MDPVVSLKPVIFLDMDGVLNAHPSSFINAGPDPIEPEMLDRVCAFAEAVGARIVICSAWRISYDRDEFAHKVGSRLARLLHTGPAWRTSNIGGLRGEEVAVWLDENGWRPYVILDDEVDYYQWQPVIYTDSRVGVTDQNCYDARYLLNEMKVLVRYTSGIRYRLGDFLGAPDRFIAHGCNAQGAMGSGAALAVITKYPDNYKTYRQHFLKYGLKVGDVVFHEEREDKKIIANCITQEFYGGGGKLYVDYEAIRTSYGYIARLAGSGSTKDDVQSIATCQVGAGLAGGDWSIIRDILEEVGRETGIMINVYFIDYYQYLKACSEYRTNTHTEQRRDNRWGVER